MNTVNCADYISNISLSELWPAGMTLAQAEEAQLRKAEAEGVALGRGMDDAILDALNVAVENGLRDLSQEQLKELQNWFPETAVVFEQPKPKAPYVCYKMFHGRRTGQYENFHSLGGLASGWMERDNSGYTMYAETTPRQLLLEFANIAPEAAAAFIADDEEWEEDREEVAQIVAMAERYGWDTTLYRADYLNGTGDSPVSDRYSPDAIDYESAVIAAWEHDAPCGGWEVEKNDDED